MFLLLGPMLNLCDTFSTRPVLVDGRPLLPSLPSHRTLYGFLFIIPLFKVFIPKLIGVAMVMIIWQLDLQLPV